MPPKTRAVNRARAHWDGHEVRRQGAGSRGHWHPAGSLRPQVSKLPSKKSHIGYPAPQSHQERAGLWSRSPRGSLQKAQDSHVAPPAASLAAAPVSTNLHRGFRPLPLATQSSPVGDGWPGRGLGWTSLRPAQASGPSATDGTTATTPGGPAIVPGGCRGVHGAAGAAGLVSGNGNILNTKRWESCGARQ